MSEEAELDGFGGDGKHHTESDEHKNEDVRGNKALNLGDEVCEHGKDTTIGSLLAR